MSNIGKVIRKYRVTQEIDQKDLANEIGIKPAVLSRLESGKDASQETVLKIIIWLFSEQQPQESLQYKLIAGPEKQCDHVAADGKLISDVSEAEK